MVNLWEQNLRILLDYFKRAAFFDKFLVERDFYLRQKSKSFNVVQCNTAIVDHLASISFTFAAEF